MKGGSIDRTRPDPERSFPEVLEAARAGADWAWSRLYGDLAPGLLGFLRTRGAVEPDDLVGEVFLQVARHLPRFRGDESGFRSWVFGIAYHRLIDERRRRRSRPVDPAEVPDSLTGADDPAVEALERIATDETISLLATLTASQRDVLLLRIVAGLTVEEVAAALGRRVGAVKALQRRGVRELRRRYRGVPLEAPGTVTGVR